jgi:methyl-accepting chemotaxis protein
MSIALPSLASGTARPPVARASTDRSSHGMLDFFRYHGLWAPGVRLFRSIGFTTKAIIISLVFAVPLAVLAFAYFADKAAAVEFSAKERVGVAYLKAAAPLLDKLHTQRLEWVTRAAQGGTAATADASNAWQTELQALLKADEQMGGELATAAAVQALKQALGALSSAPNNVGDLLARQGDAVQALLGLMTVATDQSNLTLDPDLDTYYLMDAGTTALPALVEAVAHGQAVATARSLLSTADPHFEVLQTREQVIGELYAERWKGAVAKVADVHAGFPAELKFDATWKALQDFDALLTKNTSASDLDRSGQAVRAALLQSQQLSMARLDELLGVRVAGFESKRNLVLAVLVISLLTVIYLFMSFGKVLSGGLKEVAFHIEAMREGDLTTSPRAWGSDEAAGLMQTLQDMQASLRRIVLQVRGASDNIVSASTQISSGANDLSSRTEQSAANLQETASSMEQIASTVKSNEETISEATGLAGTNASVAERGGQIIGEVVSTMAGINASSNRIGDIIGTIDGIAFQTNILALNAAVEAARAGEQGRGFAVVASEVRALAQRSSAAAREIKELIGTSIQQVESGSRVVREAGGTISQIVDSSRRMRELLSNVAVAAREQTAGVSQTARSVQEMDTVTQQNAALVEETAAAAGSLRDQAQALAEEVAQFRLPA